MRSLGLSFSFLLLVLGACGGDMTHVDAGGDAGRDAGADMCACLDGGTDAGSVDSGADAGSDAGTDAGADGGTDAGGGVDSGSDGGSDSGTRDGGTPGIDMGMFAPVLDGVLYPGEWDLADVSVSHVTSEWGDGNVLTELHSSLQADGLWIAVVGHIDSGNAIVVYVDNAQDDGMGVADLSSLTDSIGALDDALSAGFTTPAGFAADVAWGTTGMSHSASDFDDTQGWRDIASDGADFHWLSAAEARSNCGPDACEAFIPRAMLGGSAPRTLALFARIVNHDGTLSPNQTLPEDDGGTHPRVVGSVIGFRE